MFGNLDEFQIFLLKIILMKVLVIGSFLAGRASK